jgi:type IV secretion system protein VirB10
MSTTPPPPPPPDDPFVTPPEGDTPDPFITNGNGDETLDQGRPNVAAHPGRVFVVLGVVGLVLLILLYNIIFSGSDDDKKLEPKKESITPAPNIPMPPVDVNDINTMPKIDLIPPPVPKPTSMPLLEPKDNSAEKELQQQRIRSDMLITDARGGLADALGGDDSADTAADNDPNSQFGARVAKANTTAARVTATHIGNLKRTIAQGRLIQATTESAINTDLPAPIRAIVSRDVYGEAGDTPLIPKGSRLIGQYNTDILGGQNRVYVMWTRVIRPDGVDVMLGSPLVDQIGQAGVGGQVDSKFQQIFSRAVLASVVTIGVAMGSDAISGGGQTSTSNSTFGTTQSGDGATTATVNALNRLGSTTDSFLGKFLNMRPTILVDQGTPVNVFVNRDLVFPAEYSGARIVN